MLALAICWSEGVLDVSTRSNGPPTISRAMAFPWAMSPWALNRVTVTVFPSSKPRSARPASIPVTASSRTVELVC